MKPGASRDTWPYSSTGEPEPIRFPSVPVREPPRTLPGAGRQAPSGAFAAGEAVPVTPVASEDTEAQGRVAGQGGGQVPAARSAAGGQRGHHQRP